jgi:endo-1,4-beta-D-glucanase Y
MKKKRWQKSKIMLLLGIPALYIILAGALFAAVSMGIIPRALPTIAEITTSDTIPETSSKSILPQLQSAQIFFENNLLRSNGHVDLYITNDKNNSLNDNSTNSEAVSYYLLWKAQMGDKKGFDNEVEFISKNIVQPRYGYMMWHLNSGEQAVGDGSNIATDADLRAIKALLIAEKQWKDEKYTRLIDQLASGLEKVGVTKDGYLAPYGGISGNSSIWTANEVWLSYSDFTVFRELAARRGQPWNSIYDKMKEANLKAQLANGLYNSMLTKDRIYGNGIDAGGYSINSMWMMVRNAESKDTELMESARKSLQFYKDKFDTDAELYAQYDSSGNPLSPVDTSWVYALVGRAAIALDDKSFSESMMKKLIEHQVKDNRSALFGSFPEGYGKETKVGQFTMQESIIMMQDFVNKYEK